MKATNAAVQSLFSFSHLFIYSLQKPLNKLPTLQDLSFSASQHFSEADPFQFNISLNHQPPSTLKMNSRPSLKKVGLGAGSSSHHSSRHHGSSRPPAKSVYCWVWACCACGVQGGMTTQVEVCPEYGCQHTRCTYCPMEQVKVPATR
jgi:hypothetical protein